MTVSNDNRIQDAAAALNQRAVCLAVEMSRPGNQKKLSEEQYQVNADKKLVTASKRLLDSPEYKAIGNYDAQIARWLYSRTLPSLFRRAIYLLPVGLAEESENFLRTASEKREAMVETFLAARPRLINEARERLGGVFDPIDYAPENVVRAQFGFTWCYTEFAAPGALRTVDPELFQQARERLNKEVEETLEECRALLRSEAGEFVGHLAAVLSGKGPDGKPKMFKNTSVENVLQFFNTFADRDLADDADLAAIVAQGRALLSGVDADKLRTHAGLRAAVAEGFVEMRRALSPLLMDKPRRAISFEDE